MCARAKGRIKNFVEEGNLDYIYCYKKWIVRVGKWKQIKDFKLCEDCKWKCVSVCRKEGGGDLCDFLSENSPKCGKLEILLFEYSLSDKNFVINNQLTLHT